MSKFFQRKVLIISIIAVILLIFFVGLRSISYFKISRIAVYHSDNVSRISDSAIEVLSRIEDKSIFQIRKTRLVNQLLNTPCVRSVTVRKNYPGEIEIEINYNDYISKIVNEEGDRFYVADENGLKSVESDVFNCYSKIKPVNVDDDFISDILKWGPDEGFLQMMNLLALVNDIPLITDINYVNNKGDEFGFMNLGIPALNLTLSVREPVTPQTLESAVEFLQTLPKGKVPRTFDLYANGLYDRS